MEIIEETITGNGESTAVSADGTLSTVTVFGFTGAGSVSLIETWPGGTEYIHGNIKGSHSLTTAAGNTYKFKANNVEGNVNVCFGP